MTIHKVVGVLVLISLIGGCAQTPTKDDLSSKITSTIENKETVAIKTVTKKESKAEIIEQIIVESGLDDIIEQLPDLVAMHLDQQPIPSINKEQNAKFRENLVLANDPEKVKKVVTDHFNSHYDAQRFPEFLALLRAPLAQKMTALEIEMQSAQAQQAMMQQGNIIMGQLSSDRLALVRKLDEVTESTAIAVDMQMMMATIIMSNQNRLVPAAQQMSKTQLAQTLEQIQLQSVFPAQQFINLSMAYTYASISDDELNEYIDLYQTEIGQWSIKLARNAMAKMSEVIATDFSQRMENDFVANNSL